MALLQSKSITIFDINGIPRIIREVSVNNFLLLKELYSIYWGLILELDPLMESSFYELIEADERIKNTAVEIIKLVGLKPKWVGIDTLAALVHSFVDTEGNPQKGLIWTKYFEREEKKESTEKALSLEEYRMFLIAALSEQEGGIKNVLPLLETMSLSELEEYFTQKKNLMDKSNGGGKQEKFKKLKEDYKKRFGNAEFQGVEPSKWMNKE